MVDLKEIVPIASSGPDNDCFVEGWGSSTYITTLRRITSADDSLGTRRDMHATCPGL